MMTIEEVFRNVSECCSMELDQILVEGKYPILFTCTDQNDVYLFDCYSFDNTGMRWLGTKTDYSTLIDLLENKITIRDSFLAVSSVKIVIEFDGKNARCHRIPQSQIPDSILPTAGEYMDAEDEEFDEEIDIFNDRLRTRKSDNKEYRFRMIEKSITFCSYRRERIVIPLDYYVPKQEEYRRRNRMQYCMKASVKI